MFTSVTHKCFQNYDFGVNDMFNSYMLPSTAVILRYCKANISEKTNSLGNSDFHECPTQIVGRNPTDFQQKYFLRCDKWANAILGGT